MREETRCPQMGCSFRLTARVLLYAPSHRQDSTYHGLCYTSRGALARTRNSSMGPPHEGSIRRPIAPCANALTTELHLAPKKQTKNPLTSFQYNLNIYIGLYCKYKSGSASTIFTTSSRFSLPFYMIFIVLSCMQIVFI